MTVKSKQQSGLNSKYRKLIKELKIEEKEAKKKKDFDKMWNIRAKIDEYKARIR